MIKFKYIHKFVVILFLESSVLIVRNLKSFKMDLSQKTKEVWWYFLENEESFDNYLSRENFINLLTCCTIESTLMD